MSITSHEGYLTARNPANKKKAHTGANNADKNVTATTKSLIINFQRQLQIPVLEC